MIAEQEETAREAQAAPYVTIVLPCYNEEGHVIAEIERISAAMEASGYEYELMCVNDASTDDTLAKLYEAAPRFPKMEIVNFHRNSGSGTVRRIMDFSTNDDEHIYFGTPRNTVSETFTVYSWEPGK